MEFPPPRRLRNRLWPVTRIHVGAPDQNDGPPATPLTLVGLAETAFRCVACLGIHRGAVPTPSMASDHHLPMVKTRNAPQTPTVHPATSAGVSVSTRHPRPCYGITLSQPPRFTLPGGTATRGSAKAMARRQPGRIYPRQLRVDSAHVQV